MRRKVEPIVRKRISGCFPASRDHTATKSSENREKRAVRPHLFGSERIFSILLPSGMLVAPENRGFAWKYAVSCAFPYLRRLCMPALPLIRRFRFERHGSGTTHGCTVYDRNEQKRLHSDNLWVVDCNRLFDRLSFPEFEIHKPANGRK